MRISLELKKTLQPNSSQICVLSSEEMLRRVSDLALFDFVNELGYNSKKVKELSLMSIDGLGDQQDQ